MKIKNIIYLLQAMKDEMHDGVQLLINQDRDMKANKMDSETKAHLLAMLVQVQMNIEKILQEMKK